VRSVLRPGALGLLACALGATFAGPACGGEAPSPGPRSVTKDGWEEWTGAPAWAVAPPARQGFASFVVAAQSNLLPLAAPRNPADDAPAVLRLAARRLRPVLGADAEEATWSAAAPVLARKGLYLELPRRGEHRPGGQTYTAYRLWDLPLDALLKSLPEGKREAAARALAAFEPEDAPAWETAKAAPSWAGAPPARAGFATVVVRETSDRADVARVNAVAIGPGRMGGRLAAAITLLVDRLTISDVAAVAHGWATLRARAVDTGGADPVAWTLWDVPLERVLLAVPEAQRPAVAKALDAPLRPE
jgi:hypothetical protein